ncbi:MAG: 50S ribosomal protein L24 [Firmicutes bacterium]|nr:50S ribosomal protein L24 [Bacillota bacterium]
MAQARLKVKKGDTVLILSGKDKGKKGKVLRVFPKDGKVSVEGINILKRHTKPTRTMPQGGVIEKPGPMPVGKVMVVCSKCNKPTRVGQVLAEDGDYIRVCKRCGAEIGK